MDTRTLEWNWRGKTIRLGADANGSGPNVLLLPALSSISSRREMRPLQERLAPRYSTLAVDWPGFGEAARPQVDWTPEAYTAFLAFSRGKRSVRLRGAVNRFPRCFCQHRSLALPSRRRLSRSRASRRALRRCEGTRTPSRDFMGLTPRQT